MGNEFGLQTLWIYELAVNRGILRIREKKVNACELGMLNNKFFLKINAPMGKVQTDEFSLEDWCDELWENMNHLYITNVR